MLKKIYEKNELHFSLIWIGLYVIVMNTALQLCDGFDYLDKKTPIQLLPAVFSILLFAFAATLWIFRNNLCEKYGLCCLPGLKKSCSWIFPLAFISCVNLKNGLDLNAPLTVSCLMMINMAAAGYVEELIFRGFLLRAIEEDNQTTAIIISAVTFGAGHIVNLANTADTLGVLLQICCAIAIGFLYTVIVCKYNSLWPCIISHMLVNSTSVFALEHGAFTALTTVFFGHTSPELVQVFSSILIVFISGSGAYWIWKKT